MYLVDDDPESPTNLENHESGKATQRLFHCSQVRSSTDVILPIGNPFIDDFPELVRLGSRDCMDVAVTGAHRSLKDVRKQQYAEYRRSVVTESTKCIHDPIKENSLPLFKKPQRRSTSKHGRRYHSYRAIWLSLRSWISPS